MSECLVWSVSLASTEEQKNESERDTLLEKKTQNNKKQLFLYQRYKRGEETGRNQIDKEEGTKKIKCSI